MKIAYLGIDLLVSVLFALEQSGCQIMEIFTCRTDNKTEFNLQVRAEAERLQVPLHFDRLSREDLKRLREAGCQAVICAGYYYRVPVDPELPMVNVHPAYLPEGRGAWPMPVAILRGLLQGGVTLHKMTEQFDEGDILLQKSVPLSADENLKTMTEKINLAAAELVLQLMQDFPGVYGAAKKQGAGSYWPCPVEQDWTVDRSMDFSRAERIFRAFYGYECIWRDGEKTYELIGARALRKKPEQGLFFAVPEQGYYIQADSIEELMAGGERRAVQGLVEEREIREDQELRGGHD